MTCVQASVCACAYSLCTCSRVCTCVCVHVPTHLHLCVAACLCPWAYTSLCAYPCARLPMRSLSTSLCVHMRPRVCVGALFPVVQQFSI